MGECFICGQSSSIDNLPKMNNISFCGTLNMIDEFWVNNYTSSANYLKTTNTVSLDNANFWKICVHFKCSDVSYSKSQVLFGSTSGFYNFPTIEIQSGGKMWAGYTQRDNTWEDGIILDETISSNDECYVLYYWNSITPTVANVELYNITQDTSNVYDIEVGGAYYASGSQYVEFGGINRSSDHYAKNVSICLIDTYIEIDNENVFGNRTNM